MWAWIVILGVIVAASIAGGGSKKDKGTTGATTTIDTQIGTTADDQTTANETTIVDTIAPTTTKPTTTTASTTSTSTSSTTTTSTSTTTTLPPAPISFSGHGDDVVDLGPGNDRFVLHGAHDGSANFQVELLDDELQPVDFPFNEIGPFDGTVVLRAAAGRFLQVSADGNWSLDLIDASTLPVVADTFNGVGTSVVTYSGSGGIFTITHDGASNFQVVLYDPITGDPTDFVVNEIGAYSGRNPIPGGRKIISIAADGNWTFAKS